MKKIIFIFLFFLTQNLLGEVATALTSGYVFKRGQIFKEVYGHGITNILTADGCYYFQNNWGLGAKASYWRAHGQTTFLKQTTLLQEVPAIFYLRKLCQRPSGTQLYASLGGGFTWVKENSYLGTVSIFRGLGELEIGCNYPVWRSWNVTAAARYLFPPQNQNGTKKDVGGVDLRAGIGFDW
jgi:hypothetical protein